VERLARAAGVPKPRLYLIEADHPNAFATGRGPQHAAVAVTSGLLALLNRDELAGVLAHELAHIKHRDVLFTSIAAMLAGAVTILADMLQWAFLFGGTNDEEQEEGGLGSLFGSLLLILLAPVAAVLIQLAVSRGREYGADAGGARLLGNPLALASALRRLDEASHALPLPLPVNPSTAPLFIVNPLAGSWLSGLFATHPPIPERIRRLQAMATRDAWAA
jgi:heat shock protein HtpX